MLTKMGYSKNYILLKENDSVGHWLYYIYIIYNVE